MTDQMNQQQNEAAENPSMQSLEQEDAGNPRVVEAEWIDSATDDPLALTAMILGITGLVFDFGMLFCCIFAVAPIVSLGAVGTGAFSLVRMKNEPDKYKGAGFAWAGIIMGAVNVVIVLAMIALGVGLAALFGVSG